MTDTPDEPTAADPSPEAGGEAGEPQTPPTPPNEAVSETPAETPSPAPKAEPTPPAPKADAPKKGISIGNLAMPARGGPRAVITRVGLILVAILILATLVIGGTTVISRLGKHGGKGHPAATGTPTPTPSGEQYFTYNNDAFQFSMDRPNDWTTRVLSTPDPKVAIVLGPPSPFPQNDIVLVRFVPLTGGIFGTQALGPFKQVILQELGTDINLVSQNPESVNGLPGWNFTWVTPAAQPKTFYDGWYLLDGTRFVELLLQIQPASDNSSENAAVPVFEHMVKSFLSFAPIPQPTETATPAATGTATPKG